MEESDAWQILLEEASESQRFEGDTLWRAEEFFAGLIVAILTAALGLVAFGSGTLTAHALGLGAATISGLAFLFAIVGQYVLTLQSFFYVRDRLVKERLLEAMAEEGEHGPDLARCRRLLFHSVDKLGDIDRRDLEEIQRLLWVKTGVRWAFRLVLGILASIALILSWVFDLEAYCVLPGMCQANQPITWSPVIFYISLLVMIVLTIVAIWAFFLNFGLRAKFRRAIANSLKQGRGE